MRKFIIFLTIFVNIFSFSQIKKSHKAIIINDYTEINLKKYVGKKVTIIGKSTNEKVGATITLTNGKRIYIEDFDSWPKNYYLGENQSKTVKITGILIEKYDLPIQEYPDTDSTSFLVKQAIQVPKGTDLKKASHRFLLKNVSWKIIKNKK